MQQIFGHHAVCRWIFSCEFLTQKSMLLQFVAVPLSIALLCQAWGRTSNLPYNLLVFSNFWLCITFYCSSSASRVLCKYLKCAWNVVDLNRLLSFARLDGHNGSLPNECLWMQITASSVFVACKKTIFSRSGELRKTSKDTTNYSKRSAIHSPVAMEKAVHLFISVKMGRWSISRIFKKAW